MRIRTLRCQFHLKVPFLNRRRWLVRSKLIKILGQRQQAQSFFRNHSWKIVEESADHVIFNRSVKTAAFKFGRLRIEARISNFKIKILDKCTCSKIFIFSVIFLGITKTLTMFYYKENSPLLEQNQKKTCTWKVIIIKENKQNLGVLTSTFEKLPTNGIYH